MCSTLQQGSPSFCGAYTSHSLRSLTRWHTAGSPPSPASGYPTGVRSKLDVAVEYAPFFGARIGARPHARPTIANARTPPLRAPSPHTLGLNGTYPDLDMAPLGVMLHNDAGPIYGPPSPSHLTRDEQTTLVTLYAMTGAPIVFGGRLPLEANDTWTLGLLTTSAVLEVHGTGVARTPFTPPDAGGRALYGWFATVPSSPGAMAVGLWTAEDSAGPVSFDVSTVTHAPQVCVIDLWQGLPVGGPVTGRFTATINAHGAMMLGVTPC